MTQMLPTAKMKSSPKLSVKSSRIIHGLYLLFLVLSTPQYLRAEGAEEMKKTELEVREQMIKISAELGVSCTECHVVSNFKDGQKDTFKVALRHIKIVQVLKSSGMNGQKGQPEASCYMCHRGQLRYLYKLSSAGIGAVGSGRRGSAKENESPHKTESAAEPTH